MADARTRGEASGPRRKKRDSPSKQQDRRDAARNDSVQTQPQPQPIYSNTRAAPIYAEPEEDLNLRGPRRYSSDNVSSSSSSYIDVSRRSPVLRGSGLGFFRSFFAAPARRRRVKKQRSRASMRLGNSSSSSVDSNLAYGTGFVKKRRDRNAPSYAPSYDGRRERETSSVYAPAGPAPGKKRKEKDVDTEIMEVGAGLAALARKQNRMDLMEARKHGIVHIRREDSGRHGLGVKNLESSRGLGSSKPSHGADDDGWESASDDESDYSSSSVDMGLAYGGESTWNWGRPRPPMPVKRKSTIVDPKLFGPQNSLNGVLSRPVGFGEVDINAPGGFMPELSTSDVRDTSYVSPQQPPPAPSLRAKDDGYVPTATPARRGSAQSSGSLQHVFPMPTDDPLNFDASRRSVASAQDQPIYNVSRTDSLPLRQPKPYTPVSQTIYEQSSIPAHVDSTPTPRKRESGSKRDSGGYATFAGAGLAGVALAGMAANRLDKRRDADDYERAKRRERRKEEGRAPEEDRERRRESRRESERYEKSDRPRDSRRDEPRDYPPDERRERRRGEERVELPSSRELASVTRPDPFQYQVADDAFEIADRPHKSRQGADPGPSPRALEKAPQRAIESAHEPPMDSLALGSTIERGHTPAIVTVERVPRFARGGARTPAIESAPVDRDDGPSETRGRSREKSPEGRFVRVVTAETPAASSDAAAAEDPSPTKREFKKGKRKTYSASTERERDLIQEDADRVYRETIAANKAAAKEAAPRPVTPENNDEDKDKGPYDSPNADFELDHVMHPKDMPTFSPVVLRAYPASQSREIEGPFDPASMGLSRPLLNLVYPTPSPEAQKLRDAEVERTRSPETKDREVSDRDIATVSPSESKGVKWGEDEVKSFVPVTPYDEASDPIHAAAAPEPAKKKSSRWGDVRGAFIARAAEIKAEEAAEEKKRVEAASPAEAFEYRGITVEPEHANDRDASHERDLPKDDHRDPGPPPSVGPKPGATSENRGMPGAFDDDIDFAATVAAGLQDSGFDPNIVINDSNFARRSSPPGSDVETVVYHKPFSETVTDLGVYERHPSGPSDGPVLEDASCEIDEEFPVTKKLSKKEQKKLEKEEAKLAKDHEFAGAEAAAAAAVAAAAVAGAVHHYSEDREVAEPEQRADEGDEFAFTKKLSKKEQKKLEKEAAKREMDREFEAAEAEAAAAAAESADREITEPEQRADGVDDFAFTKKLTKKEQKKLEKEAARLAQEKEDKDEAREREAAIAQIVVEPEVEEPQEAADDFAFTPKLSKKEQKKLEKEAAKLAQDKEFEEAEAARLAQDKEFEEAEAAKLAQDKEFEESQAVDSRSVEDHEEVWAADPRDGPEFFDRGRVGGPGVAQEEIKDDFDDFGAFMPKLSKKEQKKLEKEAAAAKLAEEKEQAEAARLAQDKEFAEAEAANSHSVEEPEAQSRDLNDDEFKEPEEFAFTPKLSKKEQKKLEKEAAKRAQDKEFEEAEAANSRAVEEPAESWDQEPQPKEDEFKEVEEFASTPKLSKKEQKKLEKEAAKRAQDKEFEEAEAAKLAQDKEFEEAEAVDSRAVEEPESWDQEPQQDEFKEAEEFAFTPKLSKKEQKKLEKEAAKRAQDKEFEEAEAANSRAIEEPESWDQEPQQDEFNEAEEFAFIPKLSKKEQKRLEKEAAKQARDREIEAEEAEAGLHAIAEEPETSKSQGEDADEFALTKKLSKKEQKRLDKEAENLARDRELELEPAEVPSTEAPQEADEFAEFTTSKKSKKSKKSRKSAGYPEDDEEVPSSRISVPIDAFDDLRHDDAAAAPVDEWDEPKKSKRKSKRGDEVFEDAQESISRKGSKKDKSRGNADSDRSQTRSVVSEPLEDDTRSVTSETKKKSRGSGFFGFFGGSNKSDVSEAEKVVKPVVSDEANDMNGDHSPTEGSNGISNGNGHEAHEEDEWASTTKSKKKKKKQKNGIADDEASEQDSFLANAGTLGAGVGLVGAAAMAAALHQQHKADDAESKDDPAARSLPAESQPQNVAAEAPRDPYPNDFVDPEIVERPFRVAIDPEYMDLLALPPSDPGTPDPYHSTDLPALPESRPSSPPGTEHLAPIDRSLAAHEKNPTTPRKTESRKTNRKAASLSAVPLTFKLGNRSTPSSPGLTRPSPLASPLTPGLPRPSSLMSPLTPSADSAGFSRTKARPTSWDSSREIKPLLLLDAARRESLLSDEERPTRTRSIEPDSAVYSRRSSLASARASVVSPRSDDVADLPALPESREASLERVEELPSSVEEPTPASFPLEEPLSKGISDIQRPDSPDQFEDSREHPESRPLTPEQSKSLPSEEVQEEIPRDVSDFQTGDAVDYPSLPESRPATPLDDGGAIVQETGYFTTHADVQPDETSREIDDLPQPTPVEPDTCNRSSHLFQPTPQTTPIKHSTVDDVILENPAQVETGVQDDAATQDRSIPDEGEPALASTSGIKDDVTAIPHDVDTQLNSTAREAEVAPVIAAGEEAEPVDEWSATPSKKAKKGKKKEKKGKKGGFETPPAEEAPQPTTLPETDSTSTPAEEQLQEPTEESSRDMPIAAGALAAGTLAAGAAIAALYQEPSASRELDISDEPSIPQEQDVSQQPEEPVEPEWALKPSKKDKKKAKKSRGDPIPTPVEDTAAETTLPEANAEQPPQQTDEFAAEPEWTAKPSKKDKKKGKKGPGDKASPPAEVASVDTILPEADVEQPIEPAEEFAAEPEWALKPSKKDKKKAKKGLSEQASAPVEDVAPEAIVPDIERELPAEEVQPAEDFVAEPEWALKPSKKDKKKAKKGLSEQASAPADEVASEAIPEVEREMPAEEAQPKEEAQPAEETKPAEEFVAEPEWALKPSKKDKKKSKKGLNAQASAPVEDVAPEVEKKLPVEDVQPAEEIRPAEEVPPTVEVQPAEDFVTEPEWALKPSKKDKKKGKKGRLDEPPAEENSTETIIPEVERELPAEEVQPAEDFVTEPEWALKPSKKDKKKGKKVRLDEPPVEGNSAETILPEAEFEQTTEDISAEPEWALKPSKKDKKKGKKSRGDQTPVEENTTETILPEAEKEQPTQLPEELVAEPEWALKPSKKDKKKGKKNREGLAEDAATELPNPAESVPEQQPLQPLEDEAKDTNIDIPVSDLGDEPTLASEQQPQPFEDVADDVPVDVPATTPSDEAEPVSEQQLQPLENIAEDAPADIPVAALDDEPTPAVVELQPFEDAAKDVPTDAPVDAPIAAVDDTPIAESEEPAEPTWALKPSKKDKKKANKGRGAAVDDNIPEEPQLQSLEGEVKDAPVDIPIAAIDDTPVAESEEPAEPTWALKPSKKDKKKAKKSRGGIAEDAAAEMLDSPEAAAPEPTVEQPPLEAVAAEDVIAEAPIDTPSDEPALVVEPEEPAEPEWALKPSKKDKKKAKKNRSGPVEDDTTVEPLESPEATAEQPPLEDIAREASIDIAPATFDESAPAAESEEPSEPTWALKPSKKDKKKAKKGRASLIEDEATADTSASSEPTMEQQLQPQEDVAEDSTPADISVAATGDELTRDEPTFDEPIVDKPSADEQAADEPAPPAESDEPFEPTWALKPSKKDKKKAKKSSGGLPEDTAVEHSLEDAAKAAVLIAIPAVALGVDEPTPDESVSTEPTPASEFEEPSDLAEPTWALKPSKKDKKKAKKSRGDVAEDAPLEQQEQPLEEVAKEASVDIPAAALDDVAIPIEPTIDEPTPTVEPEEPSEPTWALKPSKKDKKKAKKNRGGLVEEDTSAEQLPETSEDVAKDISAEMPPADERAFEEPAAVEVTAAAEPEEPEWGLKPSKKDKKKAKKNRDIVEEDIVAEQQAAEPSEDAAKDIPIENPLATLGDDATSNEPTVDEPLPAAETEESFESEFALKPPKKDKKKAKKNRGGLVEEDSAPEQQVEPSEDAAKETPVEAPVATLADEPTLSEPTADEPVPAAEPEESFEPTWALKPSKKDKKAKKAARDVEASVPVEDTPAIIDSPTAALDEEPTASVEEAEQIEPEWALKPSKKGKKAKKAFEDTIVEQPAVPEAQQFTDSPPIVDAPVSTADDEPIAPAEPEELAEPEWALKPSKKDKKGKKAKKIFEDLPSTPAEDAVEPSEDASRDVPPITDAPVNILENESITPVEPEELAEHEWALKPSKKDKKGKKGKKTFEDQALTPAEDTTEPPGDLTRDIPLVVDAPASALENEPILPAESEEQAEPEFALKPSNKDKKGKKAKKAFEDQAPTPVEDSAEPSEDLTRDAPLVVDEPASALENEPTAPAESEEQAEPAFALKPSKKDKKAKKAKKEEEQALSWADEVAETAVDDSTKEAPLIVNAPAESEEQAEPEFALKSSKKDKKGKKAKKAQEEQALSWADEVAETAEDPTMDAPPTDIGPAESEEQIEATWAPKTSKKDKKGKKGKKAFEVEDTPEPSEDLTKDDPLTVDAPAESEAQVEPEWTPKPSKKDKKGKKGKKAFEVEGTPEPSEDLTKDALMAVDVTAVSPQDEPMEENFALKPSKKDKKAKKARESQVSTPPVDLDDDSTSQSKTVDGFEAGYKEDQLALARQLQAEFGSGAAKSKKSKKSRGGSQPSAPSTPIDVEPTEAEAFESGLQSRAIDGLEAGYEEDQLSLAKQLQAEFGSGTKKSKKGKKSRTSQGSMPSTPNETEAAEIETTESAPQPRSVDGLEVGYEEDQLSLAKQLQAEFGKGSKKSKKGKKSRASEVSSPSTPVEVESFEGDQQAKSFDGLEVGYEEDQLSLAKQLQAEFGSGSKKSKKGKKNRSSSATPKSNDYEEPQGFEPEAAAQDYHHGTPMDIDKSQIHEAPEASENFQNVRSVDVPDAAKDNSTIEAMVGAAAALGAIGVGSAIKHAVETPEAPEFKPSHDIAEVPMEDSQDSRSLDVQEYSEDTAVPQVVVEAPQDLQESRYIDTADIPEVVEAPRDLQDFETRDPDEHVVHQHEKPEVVEQIAKNFTTDREISSPSPVTSDYLSREPQWHTPSRLPVVLEEDIPDNKKASPPQEHIPFGDRSIDDFNRDSAYVAESPIATSRSLAADHEYTRDSGVHLQERSRSGTPERRSSPPRTPAAVSDDALARLSWPPVNDADETVDLHRPKTRKAQEPSRLTPLSFPPPAIGLGVAGAGLAAARGYDKLSRSGSPDIRRSASDSPELRRSSGEIKRMTTPHRIETPRSVSDRKTPDINRLHTPDQVRSRPVSATSSKFSSGTPPLRRSDRKTSGDLRSLSQRSQPNLDEAAREAKHSPTGPSTSDITNPIANEGRVRVKDMADVYDGYGEGRIGSPRSPTRPHSMRRRQSMQVIDLEARLEQLAAENRMLAEAKEQAESNLHQSQRATSDLADRDAEIDTLKRTLDWFHKEVDRLKEINEGLMSANVTIGQQHDNRYTQLEAQHAQATRELEEERHAHGNLSEGMAVIIQGKVQEELQHKDRELEQLRAELDSAREQIKEMQRQILASKSEDASFLVVRNEDYFDDACQRLCEHVSQWILRFSKFSDMRACRLTSEISNDKIIDRLDNAVLDGSDVDDYLADRVRRREIFMSMTMTMVWEYIFTRYLFGMDREQRQKLKSLEKMLLEVGPPAAVHQWRATTLTLLARRPAFAAQRDQDTEAVVQAIFQTLSTILPPPSNLEEQIQVQLRRVVRVAVNLSIEMRCQRAQYMMLPPLQPEYDANGDLAREVAFNAALMSEKIGAGGSRGAPQVSGEEREEEGAVVQVVLFPLVVKQGDDEGVGEEEIVVCPAQVLVARPREPGSSVGMRGGRNSSRVSIPVSSAMGSEI